MASVSFQKIGRVEGMIAHFITLTVQADFLYNLMV